MVVGVSTTRFGQFKDRTYVELGVEGVVGAPSDAGLEWSDMQRAYCGIVAPLGPHGAIGSVMSWA